MGPKKNKNPPKGKEAATAPPSSGSQAGLERTGGNTGAPSSRAPSLAGGQSPLSRLGSIVPGEGDQTGGMRGARSPQASPNAPGGGPQPSPSPAPNTAGRLRGDSHDGNYIGSSPMMSGGRGERVPGGSPSAQLLLGGGAPAKRARSPFSEPGSLPDLITNRPMAPPDRTPAAKRQRLAGAATTPRTSAALGPAPATPRVGAAKTKYLKWCDRCVRNDCDPGGRNRWAECSGKPPKDINTKKCTRCVRGKHACKWTHREAVKSVVRRMYDARDALVRRQAELGRCRTDAARADGRQAVVDAQTQLDAACAETKTVMKRLQTNDSKLAGGEPAKKESGGGAPQGSRALVHEATQLNGTLRGVMELLTQIAEHSGVPVERDAVNAAIGLHPSSEEEDEAEEASSEEEASEYELAAEDV